MTAGRAARRLLCNLSLVDVRDGLARPDSALLIEEGRIARVGRPADFGEAGELEREDLGGRWVVPGLIDPHVHLAFSTRPDALECVGRDDAPATSALATENAAALLAAGVTTVADCGAPGGLGARLREAVQAKQVAGPRILTSLRPITTPGGHCHGFGELARDEPSDLQRVAAQLLDEGADFLKVMASGGGTHGATPPTEVQFHVPALRAAVEAAHATGRRVVAHARAPAAIAAAVDAGVDRVEHLTWEAPGAVAFDPTVARRMAEQGTWADPTLPAGYRALRSPTLPPRRRVELERQFAWRYPNYRRLAEHGVRLLAGSDAGTPLVRFDEPALGVELLVEVAGYDPPAALRAATLWAAEALGLDDRGSLAPGRLADLLVLSADPLSNPSAIRDVERVMLGAEWVGWAPHSPLGARHAPRPRSPFDL